MVGVEYRILGPLEVVSGGRVREVGGVRSRRMLAALILHANRQISVDGLARVAWPDGPPVTAHRQVQNRIAALRRVVGPQAILTCAGGYLLRAGVAQVDALRFEDLVGRADSVASYRAALGLWRGPVLDGLIADRVVEALEERRLGAWERCIELELLTDRHDHLVVELTDLVGAHPLRQRLVGLLMTALAGAGRQAEALAVYRDLAARLAEETGLDPNPELRRLQVEVLRGVDVSPGPAAAPAGVHTLPRAITDFVGRAPIVSALLDLSGCDVVVVDGMAGAGKTALVVRVAHLLADRYPDARLYLDLHGHSAREPVPAGVALDTLLRQMGVPGERIPEGLDERVGLWRSTLAGRRALLVLDNAYDSAQVAPLLPGAPDSVVLVTSRRRLVGLDGVRSLSLEALPPDEAVALLGRVVGVRVTGDPGGAASVARLCGYLPLALRLAAARLAHRPGWSVHDLAAQLTAGLPIAVDGRTVRAAFDLSYGHLTTRSQLVFRRLGSHPAGEFGDHVSAALADLPLDDAREALEDLVDAHLLESPAPGRYRLHDLLRDYATALGDQDPDRDTALHRMCQYYIHATATATVWLEQAHNRADLALDASPLAIPDLTDAEDAVGWLTVERANVLAVVRLAERERLHREVWLLARALWACLHVMGYPDDQIDVQSRALASAVALADPVLIGTAHNYLASGFWRRGRHLECLQHLQQALELRRGAGGDIREAGTLANLGTVCIRVGRYVESLTYMEQTDRLCRELGVITGVAANKTGYGVALTLLGRYSEGLTVLRTAVLLNRQVGRPGDQANAVSELGYLRLRMGNHRLAALLLRRASTMKLDLADRYGEAESLSRLGAAYSALGRHDEAIASQRAALTIMIDISAPAGECLVRNDLGITLTKLGRLDESAELHQRALTQATRINDRTELARAHDGLAATLVGTDPAGARRHWQTAADLFEDMQLPERHAVAGRLAELDDQ
jgi:DNA-binding SARP family transcriptional activator/tetratricopeptide (TPR) repeat protein